MKKALILLMLASNSYAMEDLSLSSILDLQVASLIKTSKRDEPSSVTTINRAMIENSGARRIDEILEIYVPSLQFIRHPFGMDHLGIRGIISDRDNKWLLIVNGKVMNEKFLVGAISERDLPMMDDIKEVNVIRGPGSSTYGPGAVSGVVAISTFNGKEALGKKFTAKKGFIEDFISAEFRYGKELKNGSLLFYYGLTKYDGAKQADSPLIAGVDVNYTNVDVDAGDPVENKVKDLPNDRQAYRDELKHKLFTYWKNDTSDVWFRVTKGGDMVSPRRGGSGSSMSWNTPEERDHIQVGYIHTTLYGKHQKSLEGGKSLTMALGWDRFEWARTQEKTPSGSQGGMKTYREEEVYARALVNHDGSDKHKFAWGMEVSHDTFGLPATYFEGEKNSSDFDNGSTSGEDDLNNDSGWNTLTISPMFEYKGEMSEKFTTFVSLRADKHSYTDTLVSPRLAFIFKPSAKNTHKLIVNRSNRRNDDEQLRKAENQGQKAKNELIDVVEYKFDREFSKGRNFTTTLVHNTVEIFGWNKSIADTAKLGKYSSAVLELEYTQKTEDKSFFSIAHSMHQLLDFDMTTEGDGQDFTTYPYSGSDNCVATTGSKCPDYGKNTSAWADHETKISWFKQFSDKFTGSASLRYFWNFNGAKDWAQYNNSKGSSTLKAKPGYDGMAAPAAYLNLGGSYKIKKGLTTRVDIQNALGFADKKHNKRLFIKRTADYRAHAPAISTSLTYDF